MKLRMHRCCQLSPDEQSLKEVTVKQQDLFHCHILFIIKVYPSGMTANAQIYMVIYEEQGAVWKLYVSVMAKCFIFHSMKITELSNALLIFPFKYLSDLKRKWTLLCFSFLDIMAETLASTWYDYSWFFFSFYNNMHIVWLPVTAFHRRLKLCRNRARDL